MARDLSRQRRRSSPPGPTLPKQPTRYLPGSPEKKRVMADRIARGELPHHPQDVQANTADGYGLLVARLPNGELIVLAHQQLQGRSLRNWLDELLAGKPTDLADLADLDEDDLDADYPGSEADAA